MRASIFNETLARHGIDPKAARGSPDFERAKWWRDVIAVLSARGHIGKLEGSPVVRNLFWSLPLEVARWETIGLAGRSLAETVIPKGLTPRGYTRMPAEVRKDVLIRLAKYALSVAGLMALAKMTSGWDVVSNPYSNDFGAVKKGNTTIDFWGKRLRPFSLIAQVVARKTYDVRTERETYLGGPGYKPTTPVDVLFRYATNKLSPLPSLGFDWLRGTDFKGEDFEWDRALKERFTVMYWNDIKEAYLDGGLGRAVEVGVPGYLGATAKTYKPRVGGLMLRLR
jgi:hypothetical protein